MVRPKRSPTKYSPAEQKSEPAAEASRGKKGKKAAVDGAVEVEVAVKEARPPRAPAGDVKVRTSTSENQASIDVGLHRPKKRQEGKRVKEAPKEERSPQLAPPDDADKLRRRRKRAERGDGEKRSMSPEKPSSDQRTEERDARQSPSPSPKKGSAEAKSAGQAQKNTDAASLGGFMGFVQNIVTFLSPAPPRKRRPGQKRPSWQAGRRPSEKNLDRLRREAEASRKRNADKDCVEVRQLFSTINGKDDDKIEILHTRGMRKKSLQDVKEDTNQSNKVRPTATTTRKKSPSKREDKGRNVTEFRKGDKEQVDVKVSTGKKKRNLNGGENDFANNSKKPGAPKHGVWKTTQRNKDNCSEQTFETAKNKKKIPDSSNEGVKPRQTKSVERSGREHRGKQPPSTRKDPAPKSNVKQLQSKRSPDTAAQTMKKTPSPTRDAMESDRNVAGQRQKSKGRDATDPALKSHVFPAECARETGERSQCKRHKGSARSTSKTTVKSTPAPVKGMTEKDPNGERKRHTSQRKDISKQRVQPTASTSNKKRETDTMDRVKHHKSHARDGSEREAKSIPSPAKGKSETGKNGEEKRPKSKAGDLSEPKVQSTPPPTKGETETVSVVGKRPKSKARDVSENTTKSTLAKGVEEIDQNEVRKRAKSKGRDASEHKAQSAPSPSKVTKRSNKNDDNKQSKTPIDSRNRESKARPRPAGHTVSVEVVTSISNRDKEECKKKRSQSSGQPNEKQLAGQVTEMPSKVSKQRQKLEKSKESKLASTTDDEERTVYERPQKPRWLHSKERTGVDSKSGSTMKTPIQMMEQDKLNRGETKSIKSKKSVKSKSPCGKEISGTSTKVDDSERTDYNRKDQEKQNVKDTELSPGENRELHCHGTKLSTHVVRDIRNEAKRLGVMLTPKVEQFLDELKQSLIYSHLALPRTKSRHENEKKLSPKCSKTQKRSQSAAPETNSLKTPLENESIDKHPKHVKCHSSACLKKKNRSKWEAVKEKSQHKVKSPTGKSLTKPDIKGEEPADGPFQGQKSPVDSNGENKVVDFKDQKIQNNPLDGLGEELLNTLMNDRRLLDNLDALCEAIRTGQPYVGKARSNENKIDKKSNTMENVNENRGGDMKTTPNITLASELSGDGPSEKPYSSVIECDICSIDVIPFEKKFARYLDDSYLERSMANAEKKRGAEEPNLMKKANSDKDDSTPNLKSRKKVCSNEHAYIYSQRKHLGKKLSCTSITDSKQRHIHGNGLQGRGLYEDTSENKGDWILRLTQPNSKHDDAKCEYKISRDKPYEHLKEVHHQANGTTRIFSCLVPSKTNLIWEHEDHNINDEREPVGQHAEVKEDAARSNEKRSSSVTNIKPCSGDSSSGSASTAVVRPEIYRKADEIYRRIMVEKRLRGPQHNALFSTILNKLLQAESSRIMAEEEQFLKRSKRRQDSFETDTCTTVSVRSSSHDQGKDDECSSLLQLCCDRTNHTDRTSKVFQSKLKKKKKGKFRSKTLKLSQEDVSNLLTDDFEKGSKKKRRLRTEDVLLSQVAESEERTLETYSRDVNLDRDINLYSVGHIENKEHLPEVDNLCVQVYMDTEDSSLFKRQSKTKHTSNKAVYKCRNKGDTVDAYFTPSECSSYQTEDDVESDDDHLVLPSGIRKEGRQNVELNKVELADTLAMVSKQVSSYSKMVRQQTMNKNRETSEDKVIQPRSKKRGDNLKEPKFVATNDLVKVRVKKTSIHTGKSVKAGSKMTHIFSLENPSLLGQDNDSNNDFRFSVPAKDLAISRRNNEAITAKACLETGSTRPIPAILHKLSSFKTKTGKCNSRKNYENGLRTSSRQESPPNVSDQKTTKRGRKTSKDRMKIIDTNEKKNLQQIFMTNIKSVSPEKVARYLSLNRQLHKERNETSSRQTSPCSKTSHKLNPDGQLNLQKTVPRQAKQVFSPKKSSPPSPQQINKQPETKKPARNNVQHQSNFPAKILNRNPTTKIDVEKKVPISPRSNISEINKSGRCTSPIKVTGAQPITKHDTRKLTTLATGKRAQSANPTKLFCPQLTKNGLTSLKKLIPLKNREHSKITTEKSASDMSIAPTKVATLPRVAKTPKVTNIYTVEIDHQPSNCGLKQDKLNFTTGHKRKIRSQRAPIMPSLQQRSKSDINRTEVEKTTLRQRLKDQLPNDEYRTTVVPHREVIPSKRTNYTSTVAGEGKTPAATSSGKNNVINVRLDEESNTNNREGFRPSPDPISSVEHGASVVVPRMVEEAKQPSRETQQYDLRRSSGSEDCMDEASGHEMNGLRYQLPRTLVPSVRNRVANKISPSGTSRLKKMSYTTIRRKRSMALENHNSKENVRPVELSKTRSRRQCSVGQMMVKVPSKMTKSRSFLDRPAFISVVRAPREDAINKSKPPTKFQISNCFASPKKIVPSPTRKVVDARAITANMRGLHEIQCRKSTIEDRSKTIGNVTCAVIKEYRLHDKNDSCLNTNVDRSSSTPWQEAAEAKQMWWEKHGDKFEKKLSKSSQDIKYDESSSVTHDISPRDQSTKYNGPRERNKRAPSNDHHKIELRQDTDQYNGTESLHLKEYHQQHCIEYLTNDNKIHEYGCTEAIGCQEYPADRIQIEDLNHRRQHETGKDKMMWNVKRKIEPTERNYTWSDRQQILTRKHPVNDNCERESNDIVKSNNSINRYSRSKTWDGTTKNFVKRNIMASSQVKSIAERNRESASKSVERWKQRVGGSNQQCQPRSAAQADDDILSPNLADGSIARRVDELDGRKRHDKEDILTSRSLQREYEKDFDTRGKNIRVETKKEILCNTSALSHTGKKREVAQPNNTGAVPKYKEDKANRLEPSCLRTSGTRYDSEGSLNLPMPTCDVSYGYTPVKEHHDANVKTKNSQVEYVENEFPNNNHRSVVDGCYKYPSHRRVANYNSSEEQFKHLKKQAVSQGKKPTACDSENESMVCNVDSEDVGRCKKQAVSQGKKPKACDSEDESMVCNVDSGAVGRCKKQAVSQGKKPKACDSENESIVCNVDSGAVGRCKKQAVSQGKKPTACDSENESMVCNVDSGAVGRCKKQAVSQGKKPTECDSENESMVCNVDSGAVGRCKKQAVSQGKKPTECDSEDESMVCNVDSGAVGRCKKQAVSQGKKPTECDSENESIVCNVDSGAVGRCKKQAVSQGKKPTECDSEDESIVCNVDSGAVGRCKKQAVSQGKKPTECDSEDGSDLSNGNSGAFGRCGRTNRDRRKSHTVYVSEEESETASGSNQSDADYSDSEDSVNSCCNRSIENDSSRCISVYTSNTSQEDSCKGETCTSDESAFTAASEGSCYVVDEQSSRSQDYVYSDKKSNDSPEESNYSLECQKGEMHQRITTKDATIKQVISPIHAGDTINVGELYGNHIETPMFKQTSSSNKKIGEEEEVTLITPSSENILAHAVGSKKLSREHNSIKQFYKTVQIPHGPSPSSMRLHHAPENCQKTTKFCKTTRGGHSPAVIPFNREHVSRMPTILSGNNARAMKRDLEGSPLSRPGNPCRQRAITIDRPKLESPRGLNPPPPPPPPPPLPLAPPQTTNRNQTSIRNNSAPTQTDSRELGKNACRPESRMLHSKDETVFNFLDTSNMVGSHIGEIKSFMRDKDDIALRTSFKKSTGNGGGKLEACARPSEISNQRESNSINSEGKSILTDKLSGESYLHCFYDDRSINSKSPQNISAKNVDPNIRELEKGKRPTTNSSQNNNKSKQNYQKANKESNRHKETVDQLRKFFEPSKETIEPVELMHSDTEKKNARIIHVTPDRQPPDCNLTSNQETAVKAQFNHTKHDEKSYVNRANEDRPNVPNHPSGQSLADKNVNFIKAPSLVGDTGSSYSSSTCSFECCSDKHAGIPSNYVYDKCTKPNNPTKTKHAEETVPIAKEKNECLLDDKIIYCSRNYEKDEKPISDMSSKTKETISGSEPTPDEYFNASKLAGNKSDRLKENQINTTSPSTSDAINMVYENSLCKPITPSEEVLEKSSDKNTQLFQLLTRNLDGNGIGKNYLIINNCLKEIVVTVDESGFKLAAKSSGEEDRESPSKLNEAVISKIVLPQESEKKNKSHLQKSAQTGDGLKGNFNEHKKKEFAKSTVSSSNQERSTNRTKPSTQDRHETPRNTSPRLVANSSSVQKTDRQLSQPHGTSRETQDSGDPSSRSCLDQRNSGGRVKSSEFSSMEGGGMSIEQTPTDGSLEDSNHIMSMRTKSCLDEPWSVAANVNSSTSRSAVNAVSAAANKEWSANESMSKSSLEKSEAAICSSSLSLIDVENSKGLVKASKSSPASRNAVPKISPSELYSTKTPTSIKSVIKPEQSIMNEKPTDTSKEIDTMKLTTHSKSNKPKVLPNSTPGRTKLESSSVEFLTMQTISTMSFVDRSTPATSNRSSTSSVKGNMLAEDIEKQTTPSKGKILAESKSVTRRQTASESQEVQRTGSFTSSGSVRSVREPGGSSHKDLTSTRHRGERKEKATTKKKGETTNEKHRQSQKHEKSPQKRRSKDIASHVKERNNETPKDMLSILYETDKRVFEDAKKNYAESISNNEDDHMTDFELPLSERSLSDASTKRRKKKKKHSKEKEPPSVVSRREHRKPRSSNKKITKNDPATNVKKNDPRVTHKLLSQVGRWIGKKIDKI